MCRQSVVSIAAAGAIALCLATCASAEGDWFALVIGIDGYQALGTLTTCRNDAKALARVLIENAGYSESRVILLTDDASEPQNRPTLATVRRRTSQVADLARPGDAVLFYFSGHGITRDNQGYLVPIDGDAKNAVALSWVRETLLSSRAESRFLILDACHAGSAAKGVSGIAPSLVAESGMAMMLSSAADQVSYPDKSGKNSVFSGYLVEGLSGAADADADRSVTLAELFSFVERSMIDWSIASGKTQLPIMWGDGDRTTPLARVLTPPSSVARPRASYSGSHLIDPATYDEIVEHILTKYVDKIALDTSKRPDVRALTDQLDLHSAYIDAEQLKAFDESAEGESSGIGIEISLDEGWLTVISPIPGGPAIEAGVRSGDRIVEIEGVTTEGMTPEDAVDHLRGPKGTKVTIKILHLSGESEVVTIVRDDITIASISGVKHLPDGRWDYMVDEAARIGYVRLRVFQKNTPEQLDKAVNQLLAKGMRGLVLDLRFNPGGLLETALAVADRFLDDGVIVSVRGRAISARFHRATRANTFEHFNLVVLVNDWSASASEIVAGAIQDHNRGLLLGTRTFGKGSVQALINLDHGNAGALKLTIAKYYTPSGRSIHRDRRWRRVPGSASRWSEASEVEVTGDSEEGGLEPTIEVPISRKDQVKLQQWWSEANRPHERPAHPQPAGTGGEEKGEEEQPFVDKQLEEAILILKAYDVLSGT